jgi:c-di-GMP-binding flagellar brake protein YcgR
MIGTLVHANQRRDVRRSIRVECQVVREKDFRLLATRTENLSSGGMLVRGGERALTGEPVIVSFRVPRSRRWVDAKATIARVLHGRRPGDRGLRYGVEFEPLAPEDERYLRSRLKGIAPPLPSREPRVDYAATVHLASLS